MNVTLDNNRWSCRKCRIFRRKAVVYLAVRAGRPLATGRSGSRAAAAPAAVLDNGVVDYNDGNLRD